MAGKKKQATAELVAIFRLEFYRRQNNWKFCSELKKKDVHRAKDRITQSIENEELNSKCLKPTCSGEIGKAHSVSNQDVPNEGLPDQDVTRSQEKATSERNSLKIPNKSTKKLSLEDKITVRKSAIPKSLQDNRNLRRNSQPTRNFYRKGSKENIKSDGANRIPNQKIASENCKDNVDQKEPEKDSPKISNGSSPRKQYKTITSKKLPLGIKTRIIKPEISEPFKKKRNFKRRSNSRNNSNKKEVKPQEEADENWEDDDDFEEPNDVAEHDDNFKEKAIQDEPENIKSRSHNVDVFQTILPVANHGQKLRDLSRCYQMHIIDSAEESKPDDYLSNDDKEIMPNCIYFAQNSQQFEYQLQEIYNNNKDSDAEWITEMPVNKLWNEWTKQIQEKVNLYTVHKQEISQNVAEINREAQDSDNHQLDENYNLSQNYEYSQNEENLMQICLNSQKINQNCQIMKILPENSPRIWPSASQIETGLQEGFQYENLPDIDPSGYEGYEARLSTETQIWANQRICGDIWSEEVLRELEALGAGCSEPASPRRGRGRRTSGDTEWVPPEGLLEWLLTKAPTAGSGQQSVESDESLLEFMRGAHCNPHSTEVEVDPEMCLECEGRDLREISTRAALLAGRRYARALAEVVTELKTRNSIAGQREQKSRALTYNPLPQYDSSTEEYPTRDVGLHRPSSADYFLAGSHQNHPDYSFNIRDDDKIDRNIRNNDPNEFKEIEVTNKNGVFYNDDEFDEIGFNNKKEVLNNDNGYEFNEIGAIVKKPALNNDNGYEFNGIGFNNKKGVVNNDNGYEFSEIRIKVNENERHANEASKNDNNYNKKNCFDKNYVNNNKKNAIETNYMKNRNINDIGMKLNKNEGNCHKNEFPKDFGIIPCQDKVEVSRNEGGGDFVGRGRGRLNTNEFCPAVGRGRGRI